MFLLWALWVLVAGRACQAAPTAPMMTGALSHGDIALCWDSDTFIGITNKMCESVHMGFGKSGYGQQIKTHVDKAVSVLRTVHDAAPNCTITTENLHIVGIHHACMISTNQVSRVPAIYAKLPRKWWRADHAATSAGHRVTCYFMLATLLLMTL